MADPVGAKLVKTAADAGRAEQFAAVRHREQPGTCRDRERPGELGGRAAPLVVGQPETGHALPGVPGRKPRQCARFKRMAGSVRGQDHADADPGSTCRLGCCLKNEIGKTHEPAEPPGVAARVHLELQPARALGPLVGSHLGDESTHIGRRP